MTETPLLPAIASLDSEAAVDGGEATKQRSSVDHGPLDEVHGGWDAWPASTATAPAKAERPQTMRGISKQLQFEDTEEDLGGQLPAFMATRRESALAPAPVDG
ncbi:hypothetical protein E2562_017420 [Oryza meyeriana var. granulata]|uniref:Uncharacterized protein n=1 Tax=Oryza meyeriana var. granulata TaxID=110450 RepID=A0A6G1D3P9_9ORYZ|nr:hypothetical protein E2562_017420 [Oryza meyeriana var. granulata]